MYAAVADQPLYFKIASKTQTVMFKLHTNYFLIVPGSWHYFLKAPETISFGVFLSSNRLQNLTRF
jgi:hypothetical protein